jgi:hypothetical protein
MIAGNGQYELKESFYHLEISCRLIATKYGKPVITEWTNGDYIRLSSMLSHATSVQISPNTLKRIFGKLRTPERYYPQKATRDALVQFVGYNNWESFALNHPRPVEKVIAVSPAPESKTPGGVEMASENVLAPTDETPRRTNHVWPFIIAGLFVVSIPGFFFWRSTSRQASELSPGSAQLICRNPEGSNPHSAVFSLQLGQHFTGDETKFTLSFGDGRAQKPVREGILMTHYYEVPGRYNAILNYDGKAVDTIAVFLRSDGWTATAHVERDTVRVYPVTTDSLWTNGHLSVSAAALRHAGVDTNRTFFVDFVNSKPTGIDGDNFELQCKVNTSAERAGVRCSQVTIVVFGNKSVHRLVILKPGCEAWGALTLSDFYRDGKEDDLGFLAADFSTGGTVALSIHDKKVQVLLNGKEVYTAKYTYPLGEIYGLKISFAGIGTIHDVSLKDAKSGATFQNSFLR